MENIENIKVPNLQDDITFTAKIIIENRINKQGNVYQIMVICGEIKETGELLRLHEVYVKESLRQIIQFFIKHNK